MPFQPVPNVVQVNVRANLLGEPVENVLNFVTIPASAPTLAEVEDIVDRVVDAWIDNILPVVGGNYTLTSVLGTAIHDFGGAVYESTAGMPVDGAQSGEALPGQNAVVITHRTGFSGRNFRGRTYLCGFVESQVSGNFLTSGAQSAVSAAWAGFLADALGSEWNLVVVSRWFEGVLRDEGLATVVSSSVLRNGRLDSQRRRMPRQ